MLAKLKWILIVDDEPDIVDALREQLLIFFGEDEIKIVEASDGMEATSKIKNQKFDCIITDMKMPKKEGDALIVSIRQTAFNEDTPVIMLTGFPNKKLISDYRFVYLLEKPFLHSDLTELVSNQLKLGNSGDRLAADIVNRLVSSSETFLKTYLGADDYQLQSPKAKLFNEKIDFDYVSQVNIIDDGVHNSFSILVSNEDLRSLKEKVDSLKETPENRIAYGIGQSILKNAVRTSRQKRSLNYQIHTMTSEDAGREIELKKGIIIPMTCEGIHINILACSEKKKKRVI